VESERDCQCVFCGQDTTGYHDDPKDALMPIAIKLLNSHGRNITDQGYLGGVLDFILALFGKDCVTLNARLERREYLEKLIERFGQQYSDKEIDSVCPFCGHEKKGKDYYTSSLKRVLIERIIGLFNDCFNIENSRYEDAILSYVYKMFGSGNPAIRKALKAWGFDELCGNGQKKKGGHEGGLCE